MRIGIVGLAGAGKDTFGEMLLRHMGGSYRLDKFAKPLKEAARIVFGDDFDDRDLKEVDRPFRYHKVGSALNYLREELGLTPDEYDIACRAAADHLFHYHALSSRRFQQILGSEIIRGARSSAWTDRLACMDNIIATDVRFQNELELFDAVVLVTRPGVVRVNDHPSEDLADRLTNIANGRLAAYMLREEGVLLCINDSAIDVLERKALIFSSIFKAV